MANLVIVESPAKAKTIQKYLGRDYTVVASMGHVRDLPKSKLGVDIEHDFTPQYTEMKGKEGVVAKLKKDASACDKVYLATDPDREGEAIAWHIAYLLGLDGDDSNRVEFNEITKTGVQNGMSHPHKINIDLVNAWQARRILDRLVGYKLSPFLWRKVRRGLSAGRVQSVAVRLVVDREKEIEAFKPQEYWSIDAKMTLPPQAKQFSAKLYTVDGTEPAQLSPLKGTCATSDEPLPTSGGAGGKYSMRVDKMEIKDKESADKIMARLRGAVCTVESVKKSTKRRTPPPPFITSTMQQDASYRLNFQSKRTMKVAQELYEGVEIDGMGAVGLITYMRTDSLRISEEAQNAARAFIRDNYGEKYLPDSKRVYTKKKNVQDAHEAIRPSSPSLTPEAVKKCLSPDQYKLYRLIWQRFFAGQMADAIYDITAVEIGAKGCIFRASGQSCVFKGFTVLYDDEKGKTSENKALPPLTEGAILNVKNLEANQHFTAPPARYSEATLIRAFEENGIGRPSTYAPTITTITSHQYVEREGKQLKPTSLGEVTTQLMEENFPHILDVDFTANLENDLDEIATGQKDWHATLEEFYTDFDASLEEAEKKMEGKRVKIPDEETDIVCDKCGKKMVIKIGKYGKFLACSGFPECKNTKKIVLETQGICPRCGRTVILKKSKKGRSFYGCSGYPECDFMTWNVPTAEKCPRCSSTLFQKGGKSGMLICEKEGCGYSRPVNAS